MDSLDLEQISNFQFRKVFEFSSRPYRYADSSAHVEVFPKQEIRKHTHAKYVAHLLSPLRYDWRPLQLLVDSLWHEEREQMDKGVKVQQGCAIGKLPQQVGHYVRWSKVTRA